MKKHLMIRDQSGISYCETCKLQQGMLTTECIGAIVHYSVFLLIITKKLDFVNDSWIDLELA